MKNWIRYDKISSSDARRGHLSSSKIPNFSKGESFPLWPPLSLRRRRWLSLVGDPRPPTCHFFHYHGGTYLKQYLKHEESIVEKNLTHLLSFIFWRRTRFWYLESAYGCLDTSKLQSNILHFQTPRKNSQLIFFLFPDAFFKCHFSNYHEYGVSRALIFPNK